MHIATPCHEDWNGMTPIDGGRHCAACAQPVVDLSDLEPATRRQRLAEIARTVESGIRVCVRGRVDRDGALAGTRRLLTGGMAALLAMSLAGCYGNDLQSAEQPAPAPTSTPPMSADPLPTEHIKMGDFAMPVRPPVAPVVQGSPAPLPAPVLKGRIASPPPTPQMMGEMCIKPETIPAPAPTK